MLKRFLATADNHLRESQYGYASRGVDFFNASMDVHRCAVESGVRVIVDGGDLINLTRPSPDTTEQIKKKNADLREKGLAYVMVTGNHDDTGTNHWIHQVTDQALNRAEKKGIIFLYDERIEIDGMSFYGMPCVSRLAFKDYSERAEPADVLIWHGSMSDMAPIPTDFHVRPEDIRWDKFQFLAAGDLHFYEYRFGPSPRHMYGYPGSTELCTSDEDPAKSSTLVTLHPDKVDLERKWLRTRRVLTISGETPEEFALAVENMHKVWVEEGSPACIVVTDAPITVIPQPLVFARFPTASTLLVRKPRRTVAIHLDIHATKSAQDEPVKSLQDFGASFNLEDVELTDVLRDCLGGNDNVSDCVEKWLKKQGLSV